MFSPNFSVTVANKHIAYIKYWEFNNLFKVSYNNKLTALTEDTLESSQIIETGYNLQILIPLKSLSRKYINTEAVI